MTHRPLIAAVIVTALLAGCAQPPPRVQIERVNVAIPVPCQEPEPPRPAMPTEHLAGDAGVDAYVQAAAAEIERREGYEIQLRQALANCKQPITAADAAIKN